MRQRTYTYRPCRAAAGGRHIRAPMRNLGDGQNKPKVVPNTALQNISYGGVGVGVCEAPTFMEWSTMVVPTYDLP